MSFNVLIVEDEELGFRRSSRLLKEILGSSIVIERGFNIDEGLSKITKSSYDLLILDLNLEGEDGFDILKDEKISDIPTIVISAYFDRAIEGFEHGVVDFISKPLFRERLEKGIERFKNYIAKDISKESILSFKDSRGVVTLKQRDLIYLKSDGHYLELNCGNDQYLINSSMDQILTNLDQTFVRVHRSYIVNIDFVDSLKSFVGSKYQLKLKDGSMIPVGRTYLKPLKERLNLLSN